MAQTKFTAKLTSRDGGSYVGGEVQERVMFTGTDENSNAFNNKEETKMSNIKVEMIVHGDRVHELKLGDVKTFTMDDSDAVAAPTAKSQPAPTQMQRAPGGRVV